MKLIKKFDFKCCTTIIPSVSLSGLIKHIFSSTCPYKWPVLRLVLKLYYLPIYCTPADSWHLNEVALTLVQSHYVTSMSVWYHWAKLLKAPLLVTDLLSQVFLCNVSLINDIVLNNWALSVQWKKVSFYSLAPSESIVLGME